MTSNPGDQSKGLARLWQYSKHHRPKVILATVYTTLAKVMDVAPEILLGVVIDVIVRGNNSFVAVMFGITDKWNQLVILAALNIIIWILESLFGYLSTITWRNLSQTIEHELRIKLYSHIQDLEVAWFEDTTSGGLLSIINDDINQLERFLDNGAASIISVFWNVILVGVVFAFNSVLLTVLAFLPIPIIIIGSIWYQKKLAPLYANVREAVGKLSSTLGTNLSGISTIKAFNTEKIEAHRIEIVSKEYQSANAMAIKTSSAFEPLIRMAVLSGFTCTLLVGGWMALNGQMQVGIYSVLVYMTQRLLWPLTRLGETFDQYRRAMASTDRIFGLLNTKPIMIEGTKHLATPVKGDLEFSDVRFSYTDGYEILKGINIKVPAGETHAFVGSTGSGKSTLLRLLIRLYDPIQGKVQIDRQNIDELSYSSLRGAMGYVSQDVFLFYGTVRENIAYGRQNSTSEEIFEAAIAAEAHEFILALPNGYNTLIGERGQKLSGGQRQRLSIARAILRNPAILILDEATSAVDNETEAAIQRSLARVTKNRTSVVVAHRLSTVRDANMIWVLENGVIVENGDHVELVAKNGLYAALWRVQTGAMD